VRVLEARFHPQKKTGTAMVVVGRVHCAQTRCWVEPALGIHDSWSDAAEKRAMLSKLRLLVDTYGPRPCEGLLRLTSEFWSFVEIEELRVD
jgi:hypothetical protein